MKTTAISNIRDAAGRRIGVIVEDEVITIAGFADKIEPVVWRPIRPRELYNLLGVMPPPPAKAIEEQGTISRLITNIDAIEITFDTGGVCLYGPGKGEDGPAFWNRLESVFNCLRPYLKGLRVSCVMSGTGAAYIVSISNPHTRRGAHEGRKPDHRT